jgi:DNA (cytosine-5)-methyltransferase 1
LNSRIPVIDIFAGPGGLGEGFSLVTGENGSPFYRIALSVEKDPSACQTLKLRHFLRQFSS